MTSETTTDALLRHPPDHLVDLDEWDAMPEDLCRRSELVEGVLQVSPRQDPTDVLAVAEVLLPGTRRTDRVAELAEVGIAHHLLVEPGPPVVATELRLRDGRYEVVAEHRGRAHLGVGAGVPVDLDALHR